MTLTTYNAAEISENVALRQVVDSAVRGTNHASRLAKLPVGSWQAGVLMQSAEVLVAKTSQELRDALAGTEKAVVFLPQTAAVDAGIIERLCSEAPFSKTIVWETDQ